MEPLRRARAGARARAEGSHLSSQERLDLKVLLNAFGPLRASTANYSDVIRMSPTDGLRRFPRLDQRPLEPGSRATCEPRPVDDGRLAWPLCMFAHLVIL